MDDWPAITCLCPTYGRFGRLRDAVACFLLQDYPGQRHLLIVSDAPQRVCLGPGAKRPVAVQTWDAPDDSWRLTLEYDTPRYESLGHKRQALLEAAPTPLVAHWDDDDLYLPWHLTHCVEALQARIGASCAKPRAAWWGLGPRDDWRLKGGVHHNVFEGQMVFDRARAIELGGYPPRVSGQARCLLKAFQKAGELHTWNPPAPDVSYVYRWGDGLHHISGGGDNRRSHDDFAARNTDFGGGRPLIDAEDPLEWARARLVGQFVRLAEELKGRLEPDAWRRVRDRLRYAIEPELPPRPASEGACPPPASVPE